MRITLHTGVWVGSVGLCVTGGLATVTATLPSEVWAMRIGEIAIAAGVLLFLWGIKWNGRHWWNQLPKFQMPRYGRGRMYVGQIVAFDNQLDVSHTLSLTVRGYNGTGRDHIYRGVSGTIELGCTKNGTGPTGESMAVPGLVDPPPLIPADSEFSFNFMQSLTPNQVAFFRKSEADGADITMMFGGLTILTQPKRFGRPERLPIWDGISLRNGRFYGRIVNITCHSTIRTAASLQ